jgi:hypothetical protein
MQQPANAITAAPALCFSGHQNPAGSQFCSTCGISIAQEPPAAQEPAQDVPGVSPPAPGRPRRLRDERLDVLQKMARDAGLDDSGSRADLIGRLKPARAAA